MSVLPCGAHSHPHSHVGRTSVSSHPPAGLLCLTPILAPKVTLLTSPPTHAFTLSVYAPHSGPRERLLLEDPLTGRDVATGSYRIAAVQAAFRRAARRLEQLASTHHSSNSSSSRVNYLEGLFDVQRVLSRDGKGFSGRGGGGRGLGLADGGGVVADEYYVLGRGGGYMVS